MFKFQIGERVNIINGRKKGSSGVITESHIGYDNKMEYTVLIDKTKWEERVYFEEDLKSIDNPDDENNGSDHFAESNTVSNTQIKEPKFQIGDVVNDTYNVDQSLAYPAYVIKESILVNDGDKPAEYHYKVASIYSPDESIILNENVLSFRYHDTQWEKYFTESGARQYTLPAWRGELYNFMRLPKTSYSLYKNDTLPTDKMEHILDRHSIYRRLQLFITSSKKDKEGISRGGTDEIILRKMNCTEEELIEIKRRIMLKIEYYNGMLSKSNLPRNNTSFDFEEEKLIRIIGDYDKNVVIEGEKKESKDHYPPYMSDYAIMKAIKEAYGSAEKVEKRSHGKTRAKNPEGVILFQGTSKDGLTIQFYYDFDYDEITTAYPVFVDTTNRPDLRHPGDKNRKRQN